MIKVLFVCLGNICRSPTAEGIMKKLIKNEGLEHKIFCDSAGLVGHHVGENADPRSRDHAQKRGIVLDSLARKFQAEDFINFDLIIGMDDMNIQEILNLDHTKKYRHKVYKMTHFCITQKVDSVPDPYYHGEDGFEVVLNILEDACQGLLKNLEKGTFKS